MKTRPATKGEGKTRTGVSGQGGDGFSGTNPGTLAPKNKTLCLMDAKDQGMIWGSVYQRTPGWGLNYLSPFLPLTTAQSTMLLLTHQECSRQRQKGKAYVQPEPTYFCAAHCVAFVTVTNAHGSADTCFCTVFLCQSCAAQD